MHLGALGGREDEDDEDEDVDLLKKGQSKGASKKFEGNCRYCLKAGHKARENGVDVCRKLIADRAANKVEYPSANAVPKPKAKPKAKSGRKGNGRSAAAVDVDEEGEQEAENLGVFMYEGDDDDLDLGCLDACEGPCCSRNLDSMLGWDDDEEDELCGNCNEEDMCPLDFSDLTPSRPQRPVPEMPSTWRDTPSSDTSNDFVAADAGPMHLHRDRQRDVSTKQVLWSEEAATEQDAQAESEMLHYLKEFESKMISSDSENVADDISDEFETVGNSQRSTRVPIRGSRKPTAPQIVHENPFAAFNEPESPLPETPSRSGKLS